MQHNCVVPRREALTVDVGGERFRFYFDSGRILHITRAHGTTPEEAIAAYFGTRSTQWNERHRRFESVTRTHGLYWARHGYDGAIIIISCWRWGSNNEQLPQ